MPNFASNFTARYKLHYSALGHNHTMLWRIQRGTGSTGLALMVSKVQQFLDTLTASRTTDWTEISAEYCPEDSSIFVPASLPGSAAGTATIPAQPISQGIASISFVGRSSAGQKARMFLYGTLFTPELGTAVEDDFRISTGESGTISSAVAELNSGSPPIVASDDNDVSWYPYVNLKYNDYWLRQVRS